MRHISILVIFLFTVSISHGQDLLAQATKKLQDGKYQEAKNDLTKIIQSDPGNKQALNLRGQARAGLDDLYGAISDYTIASSKFSTL